MTFRKNKNSDRVLGFPAIIQYIYHPEKVKIFFLKLKKKVSKVQWHKLCDYKAG